VRELTIAGIYHERQKSRSRFPASAYSWALLALTIGAAAIWYSIHG
jgi:hypothetical protein